MKNEHFEELASRANPTVTGIAGSSVYFDWSWPHIGFGQLSFSLNEEGNQIVCYDECMGREAVRKLLHAYADFIADRVQLIESPKDLPPVDYAAEVEENERRFLEQINENETDRDTI